MVDGFTKEGKFRPIDRSPVPSSNLTVRELLPKKEKEKRLPPPKKEEKMQESRRKEFAKKRIKQFGTGTKKLAELTKLGAEKVQQRRIEKSVREREFTERLDNEIDRIIDDPNSTDARKFRLLVRFARLNRRNLTKDQARLIDRTNRELARRISEERKTSPLSGGAGGVGSGISQQTFNKLPQEVREEIAQAV